MTRPGLCALAFAALLALGGCGGAPPPAREAGTDARIEDARRLAAVAFASGRYDQAAQLYVQALERAQARDDGAAMGDLGYDLAVVHLRRGDHAASLAASAAARAELRRHSLAPFPELLLVEAVALQRSGAAAAAAAAAAALTGSEEAVARRAQFVLGLVAADAADAAALGRVRAALPPSSDPEWRADLAELAARAAALAGDRPGARAAFLEAAGLRRDTLDYPGMARALAGAAASAREAGDGAGAAELYLRAGRSALLSAAGETVAEAWLAEADRLARAAGAREVLTALAELRARRR